MADAGRFRQDLLYRLRTFTIELSPLRERLADIRELTIHHIARMCACHNIETKGFAPEFIQALEAYDWPGNIRELVNTLERVIAVTPNAPVPLSQHLPEGIRIKIARTKLTPNPSSFQEDINGSSVSPQALLSLKETRESALAQVERYYLHDLMLHTGGNIHKACQISGLRRARLYELLKKYDISKA